MKNILICVLSLLIFSSAKLPAYELIDIGLQESDRSEIVGINDFGQATGSYWLMGKEYYFLWSEKEGIRLIDLPEASTIVVLNNAGQIAGNYNIYGLVRGFRWDSNEGFVDLGSLGGDTTLVYDMNDFGDIVGESETYKMSLVDGASERHAFIWKNSEMQDLGALPGDLGLPGDRSMATGINNLGQVVGVSNTLITHKGKFLRTNLKSFYWYEGRMKRIDRTEDQYDAGIPSINNNGITTFFNNQQGYYLVDLIKDIEISFPYCFGRRPHLTEDNDLFFSNFSTFDVILLKDNQGELLWDGTCYKYIYLLDAVQASKDWLPASFVAKDYNSHKWLCGYATNRFGETHGVLFKSKRG